ncbi:hypothetical protein PAPYR_8459 [Paratrimastix pyriformis]|uniref:Uncharacterized protein n=1 Tax=Paratrimastix pyriformis TaxID=342808 RepID=A0ABQ8UAK8_9EUKA|nr:hypothetical protein PAPYR_8459 [Paratrimastix pyriformis]
MSLSALADLTLTLPTLADLPPALTTRLVDLALTAPGVAPTLAIDSPTLTRVALTGAVAGTCTLTCPRLTRLRLPECPAVHLHQCDMLQVVEALPCAAGLTWDPLPTQGIVHIQAATPAPPVWLPLLAQLRIPCCLAGVQVRTWDQLQALGSGTSVPGLRELAVDLVLSEFEAALVPVSPSLTLGSAITGLQLRWWSCPLAALSPLTIRAPALATLGIDSAAITGLTLFCPRLRSLTIACQELRAVSVAPSPVLSTFRLLGSHDALPAEALTSLFMTHAASLRRVEVRMPAFTPSTFLRTLATAIPGLHALVVRNVDEKQTSEAIEEILRNIFNPPPVEITFLNIPPHNKTAADLTFESPQSCTDATNFIRQNEFDHLDGDTGRKIRILDSTQFVIGKSFAQAGGFVKADASADGYVVQFLWTEGRDEALRQKLFDCRIYPAQTNSVFVRNLDPAQAIQLLRQQLPIASKKADIQAILSSPDSPFVIAEGPKRTQLPQYAAEICGQANTVLVVSSAGALTPWADHVKGQFTRDHHQPGDDSIDTRHGTRIRFMLEEYVIKFALTNPLLEGQPEGDYDRFRLPVGVMILYDFHQRRLLGDLVLALGRKIARARPNFHMVVVITQPQPLFSPEEVFFPMTTPFASKQDLISVLERYIPIAKGNILMFLPWESAWEHSDLDDFAQEVADRPSAKHKFDVERVEWFLPSKARSKPIILFGGYSASATKLLSNPTTVIDCGCRTVRRVDPATRIFSHELVPTSAATALLRAQLADGPGAQVIRLYSPTTSPRPPFLPGVVLDTDMIDVFYLTSKVFGLADSDLFEMPPISNLTVLEPQLGLVDQGTHNLTDRGRLFTSMLFTAMLFEKETLSWRKTYKVPRTSRIFAFVADLLARCPDPILCGLGLYLDFAQSTRVRPPQPLDPASGWLPSTWHCKPRAISICLSCLYPIGRSSAPVNLEVVCRSPDRVAFVSPKSCLLQCRPTPGTGPRYLVALDSHTTTKGTLTLDLVHPLYDLARPPCASVPPPLDMTALPPLPNVGAGLFRRLRAELLKETTPFVRMAHDRARATMEFWAPAAHLPAVQQAVQRVVQFSAQQPDRRRVCFGVGEVQLDIADGGIPVAPPVAMAPCEFRVRAPSCSQSDMEEDADAEKAQIQALLEKKAPAVVVFDNGDLAIPCDSADEMAEVLTKLPGSAPMNWDPRVHPPTVKAATDFITHVATLRPPRGVLSAAAQAEVYIPSNRSDLRKWVSQIAAHYGCRAIDKGATWTTILGPTTIACIQTATSLQHEVNPILFTLPPQFSPQDRDGCWPAPQKRSEFMQRICRSCDDFKTRRAVYPLHSCEQEALRSESGYAKFGQFCREHEQQCTVVLTHDGTWVELSSPETTDVQATVESFTRMMAELMGGERPTTCCVYCASPMLRCLATLPACRAPVACEDLEASDGWPFFLDRSLNSPESSFTSCPTPACTGVVDKTRGWTECRQCHAFVCGQCHTASVEHARLTCEQYQALVAAQKAQAPEKVATDFFAAVTSAARQWVAAHSIDIPPPPMRPNPGLTEGPLLCPAAVRFLKLAGDRPELMSKGFFAFHKTHDPEADIRQGFDPSKRPQAGLAFGSGDYFSLGPYDPAAGGKDTSASASAAVPSAASAVASPARVTVVAFILRSAAPKMVPNCCCVVDNPPDWESSYCLPVGVIPSCLAAGADFLNMLRSCFPKVLLPAITPAQCTKRLRLTFKCPDQPEQPFPFRLEWHCTHGHEDTALVFPPPGLAPHYWQRVAENPTTSLWDIPRGAPALCFRCGEEHLVMPTLRCAHCGATMEATIETPNTKKPLELPSPAAVEPGPIRSTPEGSGLSMLVAIANPPGTALTNCLRELEVGFNRICQYRNLNLRVHYFSQATKEILCDAIKTHRPTVLVLVSHGEWEHQTLHGQSTTDSAKLTSPELIGYLEKAGCLPGSLRAAALCACCSGKTGLALRGRGVHRVVATRDPIMEWEGAKFLSVFVFGLAESGLGDDPAGGPSDQFEKMALEAQRAAHAELTASWKAKATAQSGGAERVVPLGVESQPQVGDTDPAQPGRQALHQGLGGMEITRSSDPAQGDDVVPQTRRPVQQDEPHVCPLIIKAQEWDEFRAAHPWSDPPQPVDAEPSSPGAPPVAPSCAPSASNPYATFW